MSVVTERVTPVAQSCVAEKIIQFNDGPVGIVCGLEDSHEGLHKAALQDADSAEPAGWVTWR